MVKLLSSIKEPVRIALIKLILHFKKVDYSNNIIILSDPRGGSTFLMNMLNLIPNTSIIWEPLHVKRGLVPSSLNFGWMPYIPEYEVWNEAHNVFADIFSGVRINEWSTQVSSPSDYLFTKRFIVKFVRANALLPWIVNNFEFKNRPIYLLRHPVPTAISQIKEFYHKDPFVEFEVPKQVFNEFYKQNIDFLKSLKTKLEQQVAIWCIHNVRTIKNEKNNKDWLTVFYENLLTNPENEFGRIGNELGYRFSKSELQKITAPSRTDFKKDFIPDPYKQISKWKDQLSGSELDKIDRILKHFNIEIYSAYDSMPQI
jgi:hypothetical protein